MRITTAESDASRRGSRSEAFSGTVLPWVECLECRHCRACVSRRTRSMGLHPELSPVGWTAGFVLPLGARRQSLWTCSVAQHRTRRRSLVQCCRVLDSGWTVIVGPASHDEPEPWAATRAGPCAPDLQECAVLAGPGLPTVSASYPSQSGSVKLGPFRTTSAHHSTRPWADQVGPAVWSARVLQGRPPQTDLSATRWPRSARSALLPVPPSGFTDGLRPNTSRRTQTLRTRYGQSRAGPATRSSVSGPAGLAPSQVTVKFRLASRPTRPGLESR